MRVPHRLYHDSDYLLTEIKTTKEDVVVHGEKVPQFQTFTWRDTRGEPHTITRDDIDRALRHVVAWPSLPWKKLERLRNYLSAVPLHLRRDPIWTEAAAGASVISSIFKSRYVETSKLNLLTGRLTQARFATAVAQLVEWDHYEFHPFYNFRNWAPSDESFNFFDDMVLQQSVTFQLLPDALTLLPVNPLWILLATEHINQCFRKPTEFDGGTRFEAQNHAICEATDRHMAKIQQLINPKMRVDPGTEEMPLFHSVRDTTGVHHRRSLWATNAKG
jgi:hypothetical protein